ncbi:MAG TPA: nitroreductase family protein, partial [Spirochaetia bacterium]|nr:nitroreductase family protein [Spirochaetia bacterium]
IETDLAVAMDHIILAAENEGVATCWVAAFETSLLRTALMLGSDDRVYCMTPLGYPRPGFAKKGQKQRRPLSELVKYV